MEFHKTARIKNQPQTVSEVFSLLFSKICNAASAGIGFGKIPLRAHFGVFIVLMSVGLRAYGKLEGHNILKVPFVKTGGDIIYGKI